MHNVYEYYLEQLRYNLQNLGMKKDLRPFYKELSETTTRLYSLATKVIKTIKNGVEKQQQLGCVRYILYLLQYEPQRRGNAIRQTQNTIRKIEQKENQFLRNTFSGK